MQLYFYNGQSTTYLITTKGKLYNSKTKKWLKGQISKNGYLTYNISLNNEKKRLFAHRMVMMTYCPKEGQENLEVNHKDCNKLNNNLNNLEWVTSKQNKQHAIENDLFYGLKKVYCFNENKELVSEFKSINEASRLTGFSASTLSQACKLINKILACGYYWSFDNNNSFQTNQITTGKAKTVGKYNKNTLELLEIYPSLSEAARQNNLARNHIGECCNKRINSYGGFIWNFI